MAPMRRGLVHAMAWTLATGAAVTLSWWGVHTVVVGTVYDRPRALPITGDNATTQRARPQSSSTHRPPSPPPSPSPSATASPEPSRTSDDKPSATPPAKPSEKDPPPDAGADSAANGDVRSYPVDGGRVVFDLGTHSAELVSATPEAGWQMQVWKQDFWIRVTFTQGDREISVFCTWHDSAPRVQVDER
ncbi:hypothetical protein ACFT9I_12560 [Streptomyces sp. NPDC057137]|uniref:hypothetical protein n=1 Tax=Streptomyces sp. NPDC057137 TaxID=3346030 RepID=UPI00362739D9